MNGKPGRRKINPAIRKRMVHAARPPKRVTLEFRRRFSERAIPLPSKIGTREKNIWYGLKKVQLRKKITAVDDAKGQMERELIRWARTEKKIRPEMIEEMLPLSRKILMKELQLTRMELYNEFLTIQRVISMRKNLTPEVEKKIWVKYGKATRPYEKFEQQLLHLLENDTTHKKYIATFVEKARTT